MYDNPVLLASATLWFLPLPYLLSGALVRLIGGPDHEYRTRLSIAAGSLVVAWSAAFLLPIAVGAPRTWNTYTLAGLAIGAVGCAAITTLLVRSTLGAQRAAAALVPLADRATELWAEARPYAKPQHERAIAPALDEAREAIAEKDGKDAARLLRAVVATTRHALNDSPGRGHGAPTDAIKTQAATLLADIEAFMDAHDAR
ncbi:hypothetical protein [Streptomyces sp. NRRL B-24484]|uniref:hypothetical protein n=1 Tax=Streptomyces sp. NRRL B-24484 TaxID=1463833 RepID=UPI0004BFF2D4|nr:hypothetical protein [Streptomyces sp. NRRL B-24484]